MAKFSVDLNNNGSVALKIGLFSLEMLVFNCCSIGTTAQLIYKVKLVWSNL